MKVLWFSPVPLSAMCKELNLSPPFGGGWVESMLQELSRHKEFEIAVAWAHRDLRTPRRFSKDGVQYYVMTDPGWLVRGQGVLRKVSNRLEPFLGNIRDRRALAEAVAVVKDYNPDLIHVFGAEHGYGLVASQVRQPTVIWIQGILDVYQCHYFGGMSYLGRFFRPSLWLNYLRVRSEATREAEIFRNSRYFIGRTRWDAAHQARLQPHGCYYTVQDCMRAEFYYAIPWNRLSARDLIIYTTTSGALLKGTDVLINAVALLRTRSPNIQLRVAGLESTNPVARRLVHLVAELGIHEQVKFLGQLDAVQIVYELQQARVFVLPSFIENNPNSLIEAQLVGTPTIAAFVGGVPDIVSDGETGLLFQAGDSSTLAAQIMRVLESDELATRLSNQARHVTHLRNSRSLIVRDLFEAYRNILETVRS